MGIAVSVLHRESAARCLVSNNGLSTTHEPSAKLGNQQHEEHYYRRSPRARDVMDLTHYQRSEGRDQITRRLGYGRQPGCVTAVRRAHDE